MALRTSLRPYRAALLASLGLAPATSFVACSSSDEGSTTPPATGGSSGASVTDSGAGGAHGGGGSASGGSSGKGGASGSAGSGSGGVSPSGDAGSGICKNPTPRLGLDGKPTGFVDCDGGFSHRVEKKECASRLPRATTCGSGTPVDDAGIHDGLCSKDSDCTAAPNGHCELAALAGCNCEYGCKTDADCSTGELCACGDPVGTCIAAACTVDSDCGDLLCMSSSNGACGVTFGCETKTDTCVTSDDCHSDAGPMQCAFMTDHHECTFTHPCGTGRPFLVDGEARVASVRRTTSWCSSLTPDVGELSDEERAELGAHWTDVALMEHASIAAFARFTMDLLAFGAPPALLVDAQQALADETVHARDAFALASTYLGRPVGPGLLSTISSSDEERDVLLTTIVEGCIGESIAAVEAREALAGATDPAVVAALSRVAEDEARHAELAFRFIQFVLSGSDRALAAKTARALLDAADGDVAFSSAPAAVPSPRTLAHGMLPGDLRREIRRSVLREVVRPAAEALVGRYVPSFAMTTRFRPPCLAT